MILCSLLTYSACVVNRLLQQSRLDSSEAMAYFYCSRTSGHTERQDPPKILRSLLRQLAASLPGLPLKPPVISLYKEEMAMGSQQAQPNIRESENLIRELLQQHYSHVTIVLDALDECDPKTRAEMFTVLARIAYTQGVAVKVLISSRNEPDIFEHFGASSNFYINTKNNSEDIRKLVNSEIDNRLLHGKASEAIRSVVKEELNLKAQGMFRWAALQVDALCDPDYIHSENDVHELLRVLPGTLEQTYSETLAKFQHYPKSSKEAVHNVLKLLMCAEFMMSLEEVVSAVIILSDTALDTSDLIRMARGLIVEDQQYIVLRFAHLSVREYLECHPEFSEESAHAVAAEACLKTFIDEGRIAGASQSKISKEARKRKEAAMSIFHTYGHIHLGRHCKKSGAKRHEGRLQRLLLYFLADEEGKEVFSYWNSYCFQTDLGTAPGTCSERRNCSSRPAQPLFMACVYGFEDIAHRIVLSDDKALEAENFYQRNPLEVAATYSNYGVTKTLYEIAAKARYSCIRPERLLVAAAEGSVEVLQFLLNQNIMIRSFGKILAAAGANPKHAKDMVSLLIQRMPNINESILEDVIACSPSIETIELLLLHLKPLRISESLLLAATGNRRAGWELVEMLLSRSGEFVLTEDFFISAGIGGKRKHGPKVVELLLAHPKRCEITEEILYTVAAHGHRNSKQCLELLLTQVAELGDNEDMLCAGAQNMYAGPEVLDLFLDHSKDPHITQQVIQSAIRNRWHAKELLERLIAHPRCSNISEETAYVMTETWSGQRDVFRFVFERLKNVEVTEALLQAVARDRSADDMSYLLSKPRAFPISEAIVTAAASNLFEGARMIPLLLDCAVEVQVQLSEDFLLAVIRSAQAPELMTYLIERGWKIPVTENIVTEAITNFRHGKFLMNLLSDLSGGIAVTSGILEAAAQQDDVDVMACLLQRKEKLEISESILKASIQPYTTNNGTLKMLLGHPGRPGITKAMLETAAEKGRLSTLELLLDQPDAPKPTSEMITLAASHNSLSKALVEHLLTFSDLLITEETMIAAAGNHSAFSDTPAVMKLLLSRPHSDLLVSERVLQTAASNKTHSKELIRLLLSLPHLETKITPKIVEAAVLKAATLSSYIPHAFSSTLRLLLSSCKQPITGTQLLLEAAAERRDGKWIVQCLLRHFGDIPITQNALKAAAANEEGGLSVMRLFLTRPGISASIDVFQAAASNRYQGTQMMQLLLAHSPKDIELPEEVTIAAIGNAYCGGSLLEILLARAQGISITTKVLDATGMNQVLGKSLRLRLLKEAILKVDEQLVQEIFAKINQGGNGLQEALFMAICRGDGQLVKYLIHHNADVTARAGELGSALGVAVHAGHLGIVGILLDYGANVNSYSSLRGSVLEVACDQGYFEIARHLVHHGTDLDQMDSMGRTLFHRALRHKGVAAADFLLSVGSSASMLDYQNLSGLHHAAYGNSTEIIKRLLELGANVNEVDSYGWTPLHWAARVGNTAAAEQLLEAGAKKTKTDSQGRTAFDIAAFCAKRHLQALLWVPDTPHSTIGGRSAPYRDACCDACDLVIYHSTRLSDCPHGLIVSQDIYGPRHKCNRCFDYDLCFRCITDAKLFHDTCDFHIVE